LTVTAEGVAVRADGRLAGGVSNGREGEGESSDDGLGNHFDGVVWVGFERSKERREEIG